MILKDGKTVILKEQIFISSILTLYVFIFITKENNFKLIEITYTTSK